jgi:outer membrane lipoprotein SlyB
MIKETLSGFKDTMALEIGKIAAAKSASSGGDSAGGLGSMLGAMAGGLAGAAAGGPANDTPESDRIVETN